MEVPGHALVGLQRDLRVLGACRASLHNVVIALPQLRNVFSEISLKTLRGFEASFLRLALTKRWAQDGLFLTGAMTLS